MKTLLGALALLLLPLAVSATDKGDTRKTPVTQVAALDTAEPTALSEAQAWLRSINYNLTLEQVQSLKMLRLQLYGSFNGVSTQTLISNENMRHLRMLKSLETLALPTWTTDDGLSNVTGLTRLRTLNAPNCRITNNGMAYIARLTDLRSLVLTGANISDTGIQNLGSLTNLEILNLSNTGITDAGTATIGNLATLKKLFLNRTKITDESIPHIVKLQGLRRLDVTGTQITASGRQQIAGKIPGITIH